jgi:hypothetical protein
MEDFNQIVKPKFAKKLDALGIKIVSDLKNYLEKNDIKASGNLISSIKHKVYEATSYNLSIQILADDYFKYIEEGRKPGKFVPIKPLSEWVKLKGLPEEAVYPINYNIYKYGIKPKPIISKALNQNKVKYINSLREEYSEIIKTYYKNKLKNDINK